MQSKALHARKNGCTSCGNIFGPPLGEEGWPNKGRAQVEAVVIRDQVHGKPQVPKTAGAAHLQRSHRHLAATIAHQRSLEYSDRSPISESPRMDTASQPAQQPGMQGAAAHPVQVSLGVLGKVEVDDHVHGLDVDASGEKICDGQTIGSVQQAAPTSQTKVANHGHDNAIFVPYTQYVRQDTHRSRRGCGSCRCGSHGKRGSGGSASSWRGCRSS